MLVSGRVENGHTILEFKRHLTTCDNKDIDVTVSKKKKKICFTSFYLLGLNLIFYLDKHFQCTVERWGYETFKSCL